MELAPSGGGGFDKIKASGRGVFFIQKCNPLLDGERKIKVQQGRLIAASFLSLLLQPLREMSLHAQFHGRFPACLSILKLTLNAFLVMLSNENLINYHADTTNERQLKR